MEDPLEAHLPPALVGVHPSLALQGDAPIGLVPPPGEARDLMLRPDGPQQEVPLGMQVEEMVQPLGLHLFPVLDAVGAAVFLQLGGRRTSGEQGGRQQQQEHGHHQGYRQGRAWGVARTGRGVHLVHGREWAVTGPGRRRRAARGARCG